MNEDLELSTDDLFNSVHNESDRSLRAELACRLAAINETQNTQFRFGKSKHCPTTWDTLSCWPQTPADRFAVIPCFSELRGIPYDSSQNATRECLANGEWANRSSYDKCSPITHEELELIRDIWNVRDASMIYYFGYGLSLLAVTLAILIFLYCKDLRGIRCTIHTNLMITFELFALTWIATATLQSNQSSNENISRIVCWLYLLLPYFTSTQFFWMFIEGLYLYILVVKTFSGDNIKLYFYHLIGWGFPAIFILVWAPMKYFFGKSSENLGELGHLWISQSNCPWQGDDWIDVIFIGPILIVLTLNIYFLCRIMRVLISKLRAESSTESRQYWKASKALILLMPLLGIAYTLILVTPQSDPAKSIILILQATFSSTQGLCVSVLFCFRNGEVRKSLKLHFERWSTSRTLPKNVNPTPNRRSISFKKLSGSSINSDRSFFSKNPERQSSRESQVEIVAASKGQTTYLNRIVIDEEKTCKKSLLSNGPNIQQQQSKLIKDYV
ncbi:diuretic hormone receptor-like isoform X2 [Brevipalpus obovatus]|uniref:diuretic hormone receptor-like isoform X2 n=1 Tax=Brevipalpus obovatus TaxID=246614 RepID=UPI003D9F5D11